MNVIAVLFHSHHSNTGLKTAIVVIIVYGEMRIKHQSGTKSIIRLGNDQSLTRKSVER